MNYLQVIWTLHENSKYFDTLLGMNTLTVLPSSIMQLIMCMLNITSAQKYSP